MTFLLLTSSPISLIHFFAGRLLLELPEIIAVIFFFISSSSSAHNMPVPLHSPMSKVLTKSFTSSLCAISWLVLLHPSTSHRMPTSTSDSPVALRGDLKSSVHEKSGSLWSEVFGDCISSVDDPHVQKSPTFRKKIDQGQIVLSSRAHLQVPVKRRDKGKPTTEATYCRLR